MRVLVGMLSNDGRVPCAPQIVAVLCISTFGVPRALVVDCDHALNIRLVLLVDMNRPTLQADVTDLSERRFVLGTLRSGREPTFDEQWIHLCIATLG